MNNFEWLIFLVATVLSVSWIIGLRKLASSGGVTRQTVITSMLFTTSTLIALFSDESRVLNLLWLFPLSWVIGTLSLAFPLSLLWIPGYVYAKIVTFGSSSSKPQERKDNRQIAMFTRIVGYIGQISEESTNSIALALEKEHEKVSQEEKKQIENVVQFWFLVDAGRILSSRKYDEKVVNQINWLLTSSYKDHIENFQKFANGETPSISNNPMEYVGNVVSKVLLGSKDPIIAMYAVIAFTPFVTDFPEGLLNITDEPINQAKTNNQSNKGPNCEENTNNVIDNFSESATNDVLKLIQSHYKITNEQKTNITNGCKFIFTVNALNHLTSQSDKFEQGLNKEIIDSLKNRISSNYSNDIEKYQQFLKVENATHAPEYMGYLVSKMFGDDAILRMQVNTRFLKYWDGTFENALEEVILGSSKSHKKGITKYHCPSCGKSITNTGNYCIHCGVSLKEGK